MPSNLLSLALTGLTALLCYGTKRRFVQTLALCALAGATLDQF